MNDISDMAKKEKDIRIEAHLSPEDFAVFSEIMKEKDWSKKKLAENIIKERLEQWKKKKKS
jgi:hypothetical protein